MSTEQLLVKFLQNNPDFHVKLKSSADDTDNILAQRDLLNLLEDAYHLGYSACFEDGHGD